MCGFALPMTMIAIAGLILLLVGLLTVMPLERKTARSYSDATRADFAVESGLAAAIARLTEIARRDDSVVFRMEDPLQPQAPSADRPLGYREQFFTYGAIYEEDANGGNWRGIPLFSGAAEIPLGANEILADSVSVALSEYVDPANADSLETLGTISEHCQTIPRAQWVEIPSAGPDGYTLRYAYWVEDLSGRIPGKTVGEVTPRANSLSTAELDIATILDPATEIGGVPEQMGQRRNTLQTSAALRQILERNEAKFIEPYIHYYDVLDAEFSNQVIPQGFGYQSAGLPKRELNTEFVATADVDGLAAFIDAEIPFFQDRKGGFPATEDYLKTIAASIIDYADTDSDATVGVGYRGVDAYPFVNELFDRYEWVESAFGTISIEVDTYVELWNPTNLEITGFVGFRNINQREILLGGNGWQPFTTADFDPIEVTIPPNGFRVVHFGPETYHFPVDPEPAEPLEFNPDDSESSYELFWNSVLVDRPRGGVERTEGLLRSGFSQRKWKGNGSPALNTAVGQYGDPRASFYINEHFFRTDYAGNSSWGGRAIKRDISPISPFRETRLELWPDRGSNSAVGIDPGTDARIPTETTIILKSSGRPITGKDFPANQPGLAPARISNMGEYKSLGELGNVFDPAQWRGVEEATFMADEISGGGITLAIGRPEYAAFDQPGKRAAQLLDLFRLQHPAGLPISPPININTAPREVLRTLLAGVVLDEDPVATAVELEKQAVNPVVGDIFADTVISYRQKRPLRSVSDLNLIRVDPLTPRVYGAEGNQPFFGNSLHYVNEPIIPERSDPTAEYDQTVFEEWNDSGREELFKQVMNLVSYRSNLFRIIVAGEVLNTRGERVSRSTREFHYGISPERDASGRALLSGQVILRKHYEKID